MWAVNWKFSEMHCLALRMLQKSKRYCRIWSIREIKVMDVNDFPDLLNICNSISTIIIIQHTTFRSTTRSTLVKKRLSENYRQLWLQRMAPKCYFKSELETQLQDRTAGSINDHHLQSWLLKEGISLRYAIAKKVLEELDLVNRAVMYRWKLLFSPN